MITNKISYKVQIVDGNISNIEITTKKFSGKDIQMSLQGKKKFLWVKAENEELAIEKINEYLKGLPIR